MTRGRPYTLSTLAKTLPSVLSAQQERRLWYDPHVHDELVEAVLGRLAVERPAPDLPGLRSIYASWCRSVPFDNTLKLIHTVEGLPGPLPGSTAESFFGEWLEHGTGGTCWAGNGALHDFLAELGFVVERALATMLPRPDLRGPNHGSVIVTIDGSRYIADASILSGEPIRILERGEEDAAGLLPRLAWLEDKPAVMWRMLTAPDGFPCRIDRIGASWDEWDALHQRTSEWSPFNYELNIRLQRGSESIGAATGQRFVFREDGSLDASPLVGADRTRFLVEDIGISEGVARRVPLDRPIPARPT
jgi:N-hydroxyarylamine O-acetyltransferase